MPRPKTAQELIHWLEVGEGARWVTLAALLAATAALSVLLAWKQFHGPLSEATLLQAATGRQLARGAGFSTPVNFPQTAAFLRARGAGFAPDRPYPELHYAPLYPLAIGAALRALPAARREALFASPPLHAEGFAADYFLLGLNIVLLWAAAALTYDLGRRLFEPRAGWLAMLALLLSLPVWQHVMAVDGLPLAMVLALAVFNCWARVESAALPAGRAAAGWLAALGAGGGLLFLTEYSAGALMLVALAYAAVRFAGRARVVALGAIVAGFVVVTAPWIGRNLRWTGYPVGLAVQNLALKAGDPTAEPNSVHATLSAELPRIELRKVANKLLTTVQENLKSRLWAGGAMWLTAFFAAGWLYTFRSAVANRLRWIFSAALLVLLLAQAACNSGDTERQAVVWLAPLMMIFGAGFFFVLLGSNAVLARWPRACASALLVLQALPLVHDALAPPPPVRFQYPPYFPALFQGMRNELENRGQIGRFGLMADVPAGVAWYADTRVWLQPPRLHDFYAITVEQPIGELLLTPRTLDRPFLSELNARPLPPTSLSTPFNRFGEWGEIYAGLLTGLMPREFPLRVVDRSKVAENLWVLLNPTLPPPRGK